MSKIDDGGPIAPDMITRTAEGVSSVIEAQGGMTLRDYFAAAALQGICVNVGRNGFGFHEPNKIATECYSLADAMLAARKEGV